MNEKETLEVQVIEPKIKHILVDFHLVLQKYGLNDISITGLLLDIKQANNEEGCRWVCERQEDGPLFCGIKCPF